MRSIFGIFGRFSARFLGCEPAGLVVRRAADGTEVGREAEGVVRRLRRLRRLGSAHVCIIGVICGRPWGLWPGLMEGKPGSPESRPTKAKGLEVGSPQSRPTKAEGLEVGSGVSEPQIERHHSSRVQRLGRPPLRRPISRRWLNLCRRSTRHTRSSASACRCRGTCS